MSIASIVLDSAFTIGPVPQRLFGSFVERGSQDRHVTNREHHDAVTPQGFDTCELIDGQLTATLPPLSWTVFELAASRD